MDVVGNADVALIGVGDAADDVDVLHGAHRAEMIAELHGQKSPNRSLGDY
jgi:hypothetical protein